MKKSLKLLIIAAMLAMTTCCVAACGDSHESGSSESPNVSDTTSTGDESSDDPVIPTYTLSFECSVANVTPIEVQENGVLSELPAIPEKAGYTATWQIDGTVIDATTVYSFTEDKTAVAVYVANTDTPYTVTVYLVSEDGYTNITGNYADLVGLVGTTDATVDMTAFATENLPAGCMINMEKSVISGTIAGDGSLALEIYYDYIAYTLSFDCSVENVESIKVQEGGVLSELPAIPEKVGYTATWQIDGNVIDATTVYAFTEDKTAVAVYEAKTNTPYTVSVYLLTEDGYENVTASYDALTGLVGTTDQMADITTFANENLPKGYTINMEKSIFTGIIAGDGSLQLSIYYDCPMAMISAVADTNVALDFENVYADEEYSNKVQFNTASSEAVTFTFNENAPVAPAGATHVTIYVYTGHASYNVIVSTYNYEKNFAQLENFSWQPWKMTVSEYNAFKNGQPITLQDKDGNSVGRWLYMSAPVFTTEELDVFYGNGITKDTSVAYGNDSYSYKINGNSIIFVSSLLLDAMGSKDEITFYIKSNVNTTFNYMTYEPWDSNTILSYLPNSGEWTPITLTKAQVEALVANPFNKFLQARTWEGGATLYISQTLEVPSDSMLTAIANTKTNTDSVIVYGEEEYSSKVQFNAASSDAVTFTFNQRAPEAPAGATHVTIYVYTGHASYNVVLSTYNYEKNFAQLENFSWQPWKMTVSEYNAFKNGQPIMLQDKDGNSVGKWLYMSAPVFTTEELDVFYGNGITKDTSVAYGNDSYSYKVNGNSIIFASSRLLELLGDGDTITFYIKANVNTTFNYMTYEPWDSNTILSYLPNSGEWTAITLTRAQVEALVANPFNKFLQARTWEGGAMFYISETVVVA